MSSKSPVEEDCADSAKSGQPLKVLNSRTGGNLARKGSWNNRRYPNVTAVTSGDVDADLFVSSASPTTNNGNSSSGGVSSTTSNNNLNNLSSSLHRRHHQYHGHQLQQQNRAGSSQGESGISPGSSSENDPLPTDSAETTPAKTMSVGSSSNYRASNKTTPVGEKPPPYPDFGLPGGGHHRAGRNKRNKDIDRFLTEAANNSSNAPSDLENGTSPLSSLLPRSMYRGASPFPVERTERSAMLGNNSSSSSSATGTQVPAKMPSICTNNRRLMGSGGSLFGGSRSNSINRHHVPHPQHHGIMNPYEEIEAQEELLRHHRQQQLQQQHQQQNNRRRRRRSPAVSDGSSSDHSDTTYYPESEGTGRLGRRLLDPGYIDSPPDPAPPDRQPGGQTTWKYGGYGGVPGGSVGGDGSTGRGSSLGGAPGSGGPASGGTLSRGRRTPQAQSITGSDSKRKVKEEDDDDDNSEYIPSGMGHPLTQQMSGTLGGCGDRLTSPVSGVCPGALSAGEYAQPHDTTRTSSFSILGHHASHYTHPSSVCASSSMSRGPGGGPMPPVIPVYPVRTSNHQSASSSSQGTSHFHAFKLGKFRSNFTWKACTVVFALLVLVLMGFVVYLGFSSTATDKNCHVIREQARVMAAADQENPDTKTNLFTPSFIDKISSTPIPVDQVENNRPSGPTFDNAPWVRWPTVTMETTGQVYVQRVDPYTFWNLDVSVSLPTFMWLNVTIPRTANVALFGRRNVAPSVTRYDFVKFINSGSLDQHNGMRNKRSYSLGGLVNVTTMEYFDTGKWYISLYNDDVESHEIAIVLSPASSNAPDTCDNNCNGHGDCVLGRCQCYLGYQGSDCSTSICPVLCSGHGVYGGGVCHCDEGWKGLECDTPENECVDPQCSGRGTCLRGDCKCQPGWTGANCEEATCPDPTCSNHGECVRGRCVCRAGWLGYNCSLVDDKVLACLPDCSPHGKFDLDEGKCICDRGWTGPNCSHVNCRVDCGPNGECVNGKCECKPSWEGPKCESKACDARCALHGQCKNGTCVCNVGWNGKHCSLEGCKSNCNGRGKCVLMDDEGYACDCQDGWAGADCSIRIESDCDDKIDNDGDGLVDCADSECCSSPVCHQHIMCLVSNDPVEVLLRKQPPTVTSSFYQRMKFLIEEDSVQNYARKDEYSERRVSVVRGRVVNKDGLGIVGVRVSVHRDQRFGFSVSRIGGWFDILVNGGGSVTFQFQRSPFKPAVSTVSVPWNEIVVAPAVVMFLEKDDPFSSGITWDPKGRNTPDQPCTFHDYGAFQPVVYPTWRPELVGGDAAQSVAWEETQVLQESIKISETNLHLVYQSQNSLGFMSTLWIQLTGSEIPAELSVIHLELTIEGRVVEKTIEAEPNVTYTFEWDKRNVYEQKVFGWTWAKMAIGYEYSGCGSPIWISRSVRIHGFRMEISEIGGWDLDIHHRYNIHDGVLQKGDGRTVTMRDFPYVAIPVLGTGVQRSESCGPACQGQAHSSPVLSPVALAPSPDGSVFVGDYNLIRKLDTDGTVSTVMEFEGGRKTYQYDLAVSPIDGSLYISDPESFQVFKLDTNNRRGRPSKDVAIGTGQRCLPNDQTACGDNDLAQRARLTYPKGLAFAEDGTLYLADGASIRRVDRSGVITTVVGQQGQKQPNIPCPVSLPISQVSLRWPTSIVVNPLDNSLIFVDEESVMKLASDGQVLTILGNVYKCQGQHKPAPNGPRRAPGPVTALSIDSRANLFVAGKTAAGGAPFLLEIDAAGQIKRDLLSRDAAGGCFCPEAMPAKQQEAEMLKNGSCAHSCLSRRAAKLASSVDFGEVKSMAVTPDDKLVVVDLRGFKVYSIEPYMPVPDESGDFWIPYPPTKEIYVFSRYGLHIATKDIVTGKIVYTFLYSVNTSFGKLNKVTDASGNKVSFIRDYRNEVTTIELTDGHKYQVQVSRRGLLEKLSCPETREFRFEYKPDTGLLASKTVAEAGTISHIYDYDDAGRLVLVIMPSGRRLALTGKILPDRKPFVECDWDGDKFIVEIELNATRGSFDDGDVRSSVVSFANGSFIVQHSTDVTFEGRPVNDHPVLRSSLTIESQVFPVPRNQTVTFGTVDNELSSMWTADVEPSEEPWRIRRALKVNNNLTFTSEYDRSRLMETLYDPADEVIFSVQYNGSGRPTEWIPRGQKASSAPAAKDTWDQSSRQGAGLPLLLHHDSLGRLVGWRWITIGRRLSRDSRGRIIEVVGSDGQSVRYEYKDSNEVWGFQPISVTTPSGRKYTYGYDSKGGLESVGTPNRGQHKFLLEPSIGFFKYSYYPPGFDSPFLTYLDEEGRVRMTSLPGNGGKVLFKYGKGWKLNQVVYGGGSVSYRYVDGLVDQIDQNSRLFQSQTTFRSLGALPKEVKTDFNSRSGLADSKFQYSWGSDLRLRKLDGRIGGKRLRDVKFEYDRQTGEVKKFGPFMRTRSEWNVAAISDGVATYVKTYDAYHRVSSSALTIRGAQVFREDFTYDSVGRVESSKVESRSLGGSDATFTQSQNFTYDADGQLSKVDSQEPWKFTYDANGNLMSLQLKQTDIGMQNRHDRLTKFGQGTYRYDDRGFVVQNAAEAQFTYDARGLLIGAQRPDRFSVEYEYDHLNRLVLRKDHLGNVTQYFYAAPQNHRRVTHVFHPKENRLVSLFYDESDRLVLMEAEEEKFYVATDACGTPVKVFDARGSVVREMIRGPYGKIMWDSNQRLQIPVDFCGGILEPLTEIVHMMDGKVYDPVIGQWMTPDWQGVATRVTRPHLIHLYRFNGNDPINFRRDMGKPDDRLGWMDRLGYVPTSMGPQLFFADELLTSSTPSASTFYEFFNRYFPPGATFAHPSFLAASTAKLAPKSGLLYRAREYALDVRSVSSSVPESAIGSSFEAPEDWKPRVSTGDGPLGAGVVISRGIDVAPMVRAVSAVTSAPADVFDSILKTSEFLDVHFASTDTAKERFYFAKPEASSLGDDLTALKSRLGKTVNVTTSAVISGSAGSGSAKMTDVVIETDSAELHIRYGDTGERFRHKILRQMKRDMNEQAWRKEKDAVERGVRGIGAWAPSDLSEIRELGFASDYDFQYFHDVQQFPELADDVLNASFQKRRRRNGGSAKS